MAKTCVLVAAVVPQGARFPDLMAEGICEEVRCRPFQMKLIGDRVLRFDQVRPLLADVAEDAPSALILVGPLDETDELARQCLEEHAGLVVLRVATQGEVRIATRDARLRQLIDALQELVSKSDSEPSGRSYHILLPPPANEPWPELEAARPEDDDRAASEEILELCPSASLLGAAVKWVHALLHEATGRLFADGENGLESTRIQIRDWVDERDACTKLRFEGGKLADAEDDLCRVLQSSRRSSEPLARLNWALDLELFDFRLAVLALGPELDVRYQNWITLLMDDPGRRVGTLGLYGELLGIPEQIASGVARSDRLARWRIFEGARDMLPAADAPLRLDPPLRAWLLGDPDALQHDPVLEGLFRSEPWPGGQLIANEARARAILEEIVETGDWLIFAGDGGPAAWRAVLEAGAAACGAQPVRADLRAAASLSAGDAWDAGIRLARLARLSARPLLLDASAIADGAEADGAVRALLEAVGTAGNLKGAIVAADPARICRLLGSQSYRVEKERPNVRARLEALRRAAAKAGATFTDEAAESLANLYPLQIDGIEQAMRIALARPLGDEPDAARARFITACKEVSAEGASGLAQRIEPIFELSDVVLPQDRMGQLGEIVDNIRFAPKVLEGWKFRDQLPYGLGVTALFHGPSGTGKTMASMAVANALGVQILKIDLSRVVSKYIGDTEKNIDRVFQEAQLSGAALVIDEADGLLARRSEVKDAHDRYANLEVAYLLQRMEAFEGLAILTTNLRQNLDSAFLRRLRFVIEFPRPDAIAREEIWRRCLPAESHELDDATFRVLGRRIELTGGSIRQITLRAAFLAAAAGEKIGPVHVAHAARAEFAKLGLPPVELGFVDARAAA